MTSWKTKAMLAAIAGGLALTGVGLAEEPRRNFAGSIQIDYLAVPTEDVARRQVLDGATIELSLKLAVDLGKSVSASVKVCFACHGFELGMAFFDLRVVDELYVRAGRFTPSFGEFPLRHDPANHRTSDKPLPYDMGRMLRLREWNMSILPAPWVDNGVELGGTHFFGGAGQIDYALYAMMGPKGPSDGADFDFVASRTPSTYYTDNNSRPTVGARLSGSLGLGETASLAAGVSGMAGTYDPENSLSFVVAGADLVLRVGRFFWRSEVLWRRTQMALGDDPATRFRYGPGAGGVYDDFFIKDGFTTEIEWPVGRFDMVLRWDGLRRRGNVLVSSPLRSESAVLRYTAALTYKLVNSLRLKASAELYDFSDFDDELALHLGLVAPF